MNENHFMPVEPAANRGCQDPLPDEPLEIVFAEDLVEKWPVAGADDSASTAVQPDTMQTAGNQSGEVPVSTPATK